MGTQGCPVTPSLCPQPCQPPDCHSLDILDKLILGGLLEEEEVGDTSRPLLGHRDRVPSR